MADFENQYVIIKIKKKTEHLISLRKVFNLLKKKN